MAGRDPQLVLSRDTDYPDMVIDIGKMALGARSRKKSSCDKRKQRAKLSIAVCALLNSGGGVVRMESEDEGYSFQEHGIGLDMEQSLRECVNGTETGEHFTWVQQQSHLLLFVKAWSCGAKGQESAAAKPRVCSLSTGLACRSLTSVISMSPSEAAVFLRRRESHARLPEENGPRAKRALLNSHGAAGTPLSTEEHSIQGAAARLLTRHELMAGEVLDFTETTHIEFKNFSTENVLDYIRKTLPSYASAFANTEGGYLFFGVDDNSRVVGSHRTVQRGALEKTVADTMGSMLVHHFCTSRAGVQFKTHILSVYDSASGFQGYVCAVRVEPFCCAVFHDDPESWMVMDNRIQRLSVGRWMELMTAADPDLSNLADKFTNELSLLSGPPLVRPVYSQAGLQCAAQLQECLYPVGSNGIKWEPEAICSDLFSEYPGLEDLMEKQIQPLEKGILIFSRSWAVDIGLPKKGDAVCDVLLVAENTYPVLYTVTRGAASDEAENSRGTAYALKQKLVNDGGYTNRVCVIPRVLHLDGTKGQRDSAGDDVPQQLPQEDLCDFSSLYPENYILTPKDIPAFLRALVIVVLRFKSYLSDHLGCEIFNLLTLKQYRILSQNLHKTKKQFVLGLPGTGKTIMAVKIIERIRNVFHCSEEQVLYICENQPLKKFVENKICRSVTRVAFLSRSFPEVKHIVVDEAQNFRPEENWFLCAREQVKKNNGVLWVFLDFFQSTHPYGCGLKFSELYPQEQLTKVVRNAKEICNLMFELMGDILQKPKTYLPNEVLEELFKTAECAHSLPGDFVKKNHMETHEMVEYVSRQCSSYIQQGYPARDIAILCSTQHAAQEFGRILEPELKRQVRKRGVRVVFGTAENVLDNVIVVDSIRRFSGLERRIVFGIHPVPAQEEVSLSLLLCVASRANTKLHLLYHRDIMFLRDLSLGDPHFF